MSDQMSIAERYRSEGREAGYWEGAQTSMLKLDEAHQRGLDDGRADAPRRRVWFALGFAIGFLPGVILLAKVLT